MSLSRTAIGERAVNDTNEPAAKTKGPPAKRQMTASKERPLIPEAR